MADKLIKKRIGSKEIDSIARTRDTRLEKSNGYSILARCQRVWENWEDAREQRARAYRMVYGDQLADLIQVRTKNGIETMTMRQYMTLEGQIPMQTNQLQSKVNTLLGVFIKQGNEPICTANDPKEQTLGEILNAALEANNNLNKFPRLLRAAIKDLIIGGWGVLYENWGKIDTMRREEDSWTKYISPDYFFVDTYRDPRGLDVDLIGTWYKIPYNKLLAAIAESQEDVEKISRIYKAEATAQKGGYVQITDEADEANLAFMRSTNPSECCLCEAWTAETKERIRFHDWNDGTIEIVDADDKKRINEIARENSSRMALARNAGWSEDEAPLIEGEAFIDEFFYYRLIAKDGTILKEGESPRPDRSHPFTWAAIPFNDGRVSGYINESIDHQIAINRAVVMQDWIARNQIKGFWKIPTQLIPEKMKPEDWLGNHLVMGQYLFYDADQAGQYKIEFERAGAVQYDASNWIATLRSLDESSSAISGAIQGRAQYAGMSGYLYQQQTENSATPITLLLTDIKDFMEDAGMKKCRNIAAFYTPDRFARIAGDIKGMTENPYVNMGDIASLEYDMSVEGMTAQKDGQKAMMIELFAKGLISFEELVDSGALPGGEKILQNRQAREAEARQQQQQMAAMGQMPMAPEQQMPQGQVNADTLMEAEPQGMNTNSYGIPQ